ncbi:MAG: alpha/beta fold hydrolase [Clostridiales bacterium]|nr:alpha/beta fold hydrolase [Clostridiales bacterium]MCF8021816.1 alpha/beta fold hydrolase [Clostridiales bacterium]
MTSKKSFLFLNSAAAVIIFITCFYLCNYLVKNAGASTKKNTFTNTYIVFIKGLSTKCDGTCYNNMCFNFFRKKLTPYGFNYKDCRFIQYSYRGGNIINGKWHPNKYSIEDTGQPVEISMMYLDNLIENVSRAYPKAKFILVGHSLGGLIAFNLVSKYLENDNKKVNKIKNVITLNSPLTGNIYNIPGYILNILENNGYIWGSTAVRQLMLQHKYKPKIESWRIEVVKKAQKNGIDIATFATSQDLIVLPRSACLLDQEDHLLTNGGFISVNPLNKLPGSIYGHEQILQQEKIADYIISSLDN